MHSASYDIQVDIVAIIYFYIVDNLSANVRFYVYEFWIYVCEDIDVYCYINSKLLKTLTPNVVSKIINFEFRFW